MIEVLPPEMAQFEREGGPLAVTVYLAVGAVKWVLIGALIHVGWRITG